MGNDFTKNHFAWRLQQCNNLSKFSRTIHTISNFIATAENESSRITTEFFDNGAASLTSKKSNL